PDEDIDFRVTETDTIVSISRLYEEEIARSKEIVTGASLEDLGKDLGKVKPRSLRWIMVHMIEETARHAGHADILRELTDGAIGSAVRTGPRLRITQFIRCLAVLASVSSSSGVSP